MIAKRRTASAIILRRYPELSALRIALAKNVLSERETKGWSQRELARRAGTNPTRIYQIESGSLGNPRLNTLDRIAQALDCRLSDLLKTK